MTIRGRRAAHVKAISRFLALTIFRPDGSVAAHLLGNPLNSWFRHHCIAGQCKTGIAKQAQLDGKAESVGRATPLPDEGHVGSGEAVVLNQIVLTFWQGQQAITFGFGKQ